MTSVMPVQVLLSVMDDQGSRHYLEELNIKAPAVVINQCDHEASESEMIDGYEVTFRDTCERGLSRSRNMAMEMASEEAVIFCDNDVRYSDDAFEQIGTAFAKNKDAGIIVFFVERPERHVPVYDHEAVMDRLHMMKIFSPEMAVRKSLLGNLRFDTDFGAGAKYAMGEENIFLFEAARRGIKIVYEPVKIASLIPNESSWFCGYTEKFFIDRGAGYYAMEPGHWGILSLQFLLRKHKLYSGGISFLQAWKCMQEGRKQYRKERGK